MADSSNTAQQVSQIKEKVEEKEGIPPVQQRLIYGGKQMCVSCPTREGKDGVVLELLLGPSMASEADLTWLT